MPIKHKPRDLCDKAGATHVAMRLRTYWAERGHVVNVTLIDGSFESSLRIAPTYVRTDMINGLPRTHPLNRKSKQSGTPTD